MMRLQRHRYRRCQHIRNSWEFAVLKNSGGREFSRTMIMNWRRATDQPYSRLGVVVSRRVGGSVVRSRTRRVLREAFRHLQGGFQQPLDLVLVARKQIVGKPQDAVTKDLVSLLKRTRLWVQGASC